MQALYHLNPLDSLVISFAHGEGAPTLIKLPPKLI